MSKTIIEKKKRKLDWLLNEANILSSIGAIGTQMAWNKVSLAQSEYLQELKNENQ